MMGLSQSNHMTYTTIVAGFVIWLRYVGKKFEHIIIITKNLANHNSQY